MSWNLFILISLQTLIKANPHTIIALKSDNYYITMTQELMEGPQRKYQKWQLLTQKNITPSHSFMSRLSPSPVHPGKSQINYSLWSKRIFTRSIVFSGINFLWFPPPAVLKFAPSNKCMKILALHFDPFQIYMAEFQTLRTAKCPFVAHDIDHLPWPSGQNPAISPMLYYKGKVLWSFTSSFCEICRW